MREKAIEHQLVMAAKAIGGIAPKLVSPGFDGMPDRLVLLPGGQVSSTFAIVELENGQIRQVETYEIQFTDNAFSEYAWPEDDG